jgi:hypothetical protein
MPSKRRKADSSVLGEHRLIGFPTLADLIASDPDRTTAIFKRFDRLSARNLLYLQSELAELQAEQDEFDREDFLERDEDCSNRNPLMTNLCARDWGEFKSYAEIDEKQRKRMGLVLRIRETLKEYRKSLTARKRGCRRN